MNRIIKPSNPLYVSKPIQRVTVDVDIQGQTQISGFKKGPLGQTLPMSMFEVCSLLANVVASSLLAIAGQVPLKTKENAIKPHEFQRKNDTGGTDCELCGELINAECHQKGVIDGGKETAN